MDEQLSMDTTPVDPEFAEGTAIAEVRRRRVPAATLRLLGHAAFRGARVTGTIPYLLLPFAMYSDEVRAASSALHFVSRIFERAGDRMHAMSQSGETSATAELLPIEDMELEE